MQYPFKAAAYAVRAFWAALLAFLVAFAGAGIVHAQAVDWLVNIDDEGFDPTAAGGTIDYVVEIDNNGFSVAPATTVDFAIPASSELVDVTGDFTGCLVGGSAVSLPLLGPATVTCDVPAIAALDEVSGVVQILSQNSGVLGLTATVPTDGDDLPGNNTLTEETTITTGVDLGITLDLPETASSGSIIPLELEVVNNGPDDAESYEISFPIPVGIANVTGPGGGPLPAGCAISANVITCTITDTLVDGAMLLRSFEGQISAAGGSDITGAASVINSVPDDPIATNNTSTDTLMVSGGTDVAIQIEQSPTGPLLVGDPTTFTISSSYTGDNPTGLEITTTIPSNYEITSITSPDGWACEVAPGTQDVTCTLASGTGAGANIDLGDIIIEANVIAPGSPTVTADIAIESPNEQNLANNTASVATSLLTPTVDLSANKSGPNPALVVVGQSYNYALSATNEGNADFFGTMILTDTLPTGVTVTGYGASGWSCLPAPSVSGPNQVTCRRDYEQSDPLGAGETTEAAVLTFESTSAGSLANSMTVSTENANIDDLNPANDTTTFTVTSTAPGDSADVFPVKRALVGELEVGDIQTFEIEMVNDGPSTSTDVRLRDVLENLINSDSGPTDAGFISAAIVPGAATGLTCSDSANGGTARLLECTAATLPVCTAGNDCPVITVQVRPGGNAGEQTNTVRVRSFGTPDPIPGNDFASASYDVTTKFDLTVSKSVTPDPANAGQNVTFVITATNVDNGLSDADNVTIRETLPDNMTFVSATPSSGNCSGVPDAGDVTSGDTFTCNLGTIANGAQRTVTVVAAPNNVLIGTTVTNAANVFREGFETTTDPLETDLTNNDTSIDFEVIDAVLDLLINKDDSVDPVTLGENTVYSLRVTNAGPSNSENVVITDVMPDAVFAYRSHSAPGGTCTSIPVIAATPPAAAADRTLSCTFPTLAAGASVTIEITAEAISKGTTTNNVSISSDEIVAGSDTLAGNNQTSETTTARTRADVEVTSKVADTDPVELRQPFNFVITVTNNTGAGLTEADDVVVRDTLPDGMVLTGAPTVTAGAEFVTSTICSGAAGDDLFACGLGTFDNGGVVEITVPVRIETVTGSSMTNTASISTSSFDPVPENDDEPGTVGVLSSSLAGTVYRDFDNSATPTVAGQDLPDDTGVEGITMTLEGVAFDGAIITRTVETDSNGDYLFEFLPEGIYTVTRGDVDEDNLVIGQNTPGSEGGTLDSLTVISAIALPADTDAIDYDFALIPLARIGIAKDVVGTPTVNADGSFDTVFRLVVENFSLEPLTNIEVTDELAGAAPLFGTNVAATDGTPGQYAVIAGPSGSCGGNDATFTGFGDDVVATGFDLAIGATCTIDFTVRTQPTQPLPAILASGGRYENQAIVTGEGATSGQTPATNPGLTDLSDDGADPDSNGDGDGSDGDENDPTPVIPDIAPGIALIKTADTSALSVPPEDGELITFRFAVTNTGNVTLTNIEVEETLLGATVSGTIASLLPGQTDTDTITATYALSQTDVDDAEVTNSATVTGTDPYGEDVTDTSGTTNGDDDPLITPLVRAPAISLVKSASELGPLPQPGDVITYSFRIQNTGNVTLTDVTVTDDLAGIDLVGSPITLEPGEVNDTAYTATYELIEADIIAGFVTNDARVTGTPPDGPDVFDDDDVTTPITQAPAIETTKTVALIDNGDGRDSFGDTLEYTITVENIGNVPISGLTLDDTLTDLDGVELAYTSGPDFDNNSLGSPVGTLEVDEIATYTATFLVEFDVAATGGVDNTVTATGTPDFGPDPEVSDVSDDGDDTDGNETDDPTETRFTIDPATSGITLTKTTTASTVRRGDTVPYEITVTNDNTLPVGLVDIVDTLPIGMIYVPDSSDPVGATSEGRQVTWSGLTLPAASSITLSLEARVLNGARSGSLINTVEILSTSTGAPFAPPATASVQLLPEPVFDCGEVIGRVFEDHNGNGYQDPEAAGAITNQDIFDDKLGKASPALSPQDLTEEGVPNARLATVDGTIITTDANGLFSVPCAMLPANIGSNFILKLDERSLPAGYRVVTENPRVVRLTPGMMSELNFGVALGRVARIDLGASAFDGDALSPALTSGITKLLPQMNEELTILRLSYVVPTTADEEDVKEARSRLKQVESHIREEWRDVGDRKLLIEQTILRLDQ